MSRRAPNRSHLTYRLVRHRAVEEIFRDLCREGLTTSEAAAWVQLALWSPPTATPAIVAVVASMWRRAGFDTETAVAWNGNGLLPPEDAQPWIDAGYTVGHASFVMSVYEAAARRQFNENGRSTDHIAVDWLATRIPPDWTCRFIAAGVLDIHEACNMWSQSRGDRDELGRALDLMCALL